MMSNTNQNLCLLLLRLPCRSRATAALQHRRFYVRVKLRSLPSCRRADLPGFQPERAAEIRAFHPRAIQFRVPQDRAGKRRAAQIRPAHVGFQENCSLRLRSGQVSANHLRRGKIGQLHRCHRKHRFIKLHVAQIRMRQLRPQQIRVPQFHGIQRGMPEIRGRQFRPIQVGIRQTRVPEIRSRQLRSLRVRRHKVRLRRLQSVQVRAAQYRFPQIRRAEIGLRQARPFQIRAPHPRSRKLRTVPARIAQIDFVQPRPAARPCLAVGHRLHRARRNALFCHIRVWPVPERLERRRRPTTRAARESRRGTSGTPLAQPQREFETPPPRPAEIAAYSRPSSRLDAALAPLSAASQIPQPPPMSAETLVARFPGNPASPGTAARTKIPSPAPPSTPAISPAGFPPSPAATADPGSSASAAGSVPSNTTSRPSPASVRREKPRATPPCCPKVSAAKTGAAGTAWLAAAAHPDKIPAAARDSESAPTPLPIHPAATAHLSSAPPSRRSRCRS